MLFVFLGYYPLVKPKLDAIHSRALRLSTKLLLAVFAVGVDYLFLLFVLRLDAVTQELAGTAPPSSGRRARWAWRCFSCTI